MTTHNALLGACLALPLAGYGGSALAGQPEGARTITAPPGAVVLILPAASAITAPVGITATALPAGDPLLQMAAEQDAMMHRMMAKMNAAFAQPMWPMQIDRTIQAALGGRPANGSGTGMVFTSMSGAPGVCSEHITYVYKGNGVQLRVTMTRSGDGCGSLGATAPRSVMQRVPAPGSEAPSGIQPHGAHLWTVSDPPHEIGATGTPRT
jgi:hypothetical protein